MQLNALSEAIPTAEQEQQLMLSVSGQTQELQDRVRRRAAVQCQPFPALHNCACAFLKKIKVQAFKGLATLLFPFELYCVQHITTIFATILSVG